MRRFPKLSTALINAGDIAHLVAVHSRLSSSTENFFKTREDVWTEISRTIDTSTLLVLEFGVGHGYASEWWSGNPDLDFQKWYGFDTFDGNARAWRGHGAQIWDNKGILPKLPNSRVEWIVGDVFELSDLASFIDGHEGPLLIFLDLNLSGPTEHIVKQLPDSFGVPVIIYFDDFYVPEQRQIYDRYLASKAHRIVGFSPKSAAFILLNS